MLPLFLAFSGLAVMVAVFAAVAYRREWHWTGLPADVGDGTPEAPERPAKTMWDWLDLLIVPLVLAIAAFGLSAAQAQRDRAEQRRRFQAERRAAAERAREDTLRTYLQQMSGLITDHGLRSQPAREAGPTDTQTLARTLTLVVLPQLDGARKARSCSSCSSRT